MSMEADLTAYMMRSSAITALIGTRFEPVQNVQSTTMPAVSYQVISAPVSYSHSGAGLHSWRVQVTTVAATFAEMLAVAGAVKDALAGLRWAGAGGVYASFVENMTDGLASSAGQAGYYLRRMDVMIEL